MDLDVRTDEDVTHTEMTARLTYGVEDDGEGAYGSEHANQNVPHYNLLHHGVRAKDEYGFIRD